MSIIAIVMMALAGILVAYCAITFLSTWLAMFTKPKVSQLDAAVADVNFACIITAYGSASIAVDQVKSILLQSHKAFHIYVIADNCSDRPEFPDSTLLSVIYPPTPLHGKIKSIQLAIANFKANHSHILVLDADNLLYKHTLQHLAKTLQAGKYIAVQGQRTAKNLDTKIAALDALSELYYNVTQRLVTFQLGSSATIAGSGMAIETQFFKKYVDTLLNNANGVILAEDKLLQMMLVENGHRIAYNRNAVVFDEKVREGAQVQRQRTRWLRSWFDHWGEAIGVLLKGIGNLSWNQFFFGLTLSVPPMLFIVGGLGIFSIIGLLISWPLFFLSISGLVLFFGGFLLALIIAPAPRAVWQAIPYIPLFAIRQILAILHIKASNKDFMATTHTQFTDIEHVWALRKNDFPYLKHEA